MTDAVRRMQIAVTLDIEISDPKLTNFVVLQEACYYIRSLLHDTADGGFRLDTDDLTVFWEPEYFEEIAEIGRLDADTRSALAAFRAAPAADRVAIYLQEGAAHD
jgi:hypothetical protein